MTPRVRRSLMTVAAMADTRTLSPVQQRLVDAIDQNGDVAAAVDAGADIDHPLPNGAPPLLWAIANGKVDAVRALLAHRADVRARDRQGDTPITVATRFCPPDDTTVLALVLDAGADPNARDRSGDPVLVTVMRAGHLAAMQLLVARGADPDARDRAGTPLVLKAALTQDWDVVYTLIELGADPMATDGMFTVPPLLGNHAATPPDSPLWLYKRRVWQVYSAREVAVPPLPEGA
ncbi:ankyrin repeat domain-containing protein [Sorangium sp. So ce394]|uniref:ankyrin repeat domain-containing protein n=1 Tax=Sorangium sp. So ce394 TaxID=3133310 RepID=UPI003F5C33EE